ncbi:MAG: DUF692 domain-containing protein [Salibacter sp.]|uniref:HvfB family MNIO-type RiPP peptide maturase n=1 Tax=Salibacter sp. TaxID=2010995 RepID=UPI0028703730|nr:DUF692 domain-containing protein [Salibacter sp.]MDR9399606.1 DUF692 domain-containing protein [Salibacter sp.]
MALFILFMTNDDDILVGLGFRRSIADETIQMAGISPNFVEIAPENWMGMGGYWRSKLHEAAEQFPITAHGLSLSIGSPDELDIEFVKELKKFLDEFNIDIYSEHLSYSKCDNAHIYDLLPIPFREDAVKHITERIKTVQDILERPLILENVSYYTPVAAKMREEEFISSIVKESGCKLLLDVNNVYVNAFNHDYNAKEFIKNLPLDHVAYMHMAGHEKVEKDLIIDTHGQPIIDPVYDLFDFTLDLTEPVPVLLERDFNFPDMEELQGEMSHLKKIMNKKWNKAYVVNE